MTQCIATNVIKAEFVLHPFFHCVNMIEMLVAMYCVKKVDTSSVRPEIASTDHLRSVKCCQCFELK